MDQAGDLRSFTMNGSSETASSQNNSKSEAEPLVDSASSGMSSRAEEPPTEPSPDSEEFQAPLAIADGDDISIDGTSVAGDSDASGSRPERPEDVGEEEKQSALNLKSLANKHFVATEYQQALDLYTASLNVNPFDSA